MSFDHPTLTIEDVYRLLDSEEADDADSTDRHSMTPKLAEFGAELMRRHPEGDPETSLWTSWPLDEAVAQGTGLSLNISWNHAESICAEILDLAQENSLIVVDPSGRRRNHPSRARADERDQAKEAGLANPAAEAGVAPSPVV